MGKVLGRDTENGELVLTLQLRCAQEVLKSSAQMARPRSTSRLPAITVAFSGSLHVASILGKGEPAHRLPQANEAIGRPGDGAQGVVHEVGIV